MTSETSNTTDRAISASAKFLYLSAAASLLLIATSTVLFALTAAGFVPRPSVETKPASEPTHQADRLSDFQLVQLGTFRRDQFLVDRQSGRVWQSVCAGKVSGVDCQGLVIWQEMYVAGLTPENSSATLAFLNTVNDSNAAATPKAPHATPYYTVGQKGKTKDGRAVTWDGVGWKFDVETSADLHQPKNH